MEKGRRRNVYLILTVCLASLLHVAGGKTFVVGGDKGWTMENITSTFYDDWAKKQSFHIDDELLFVFPQGIHNVWVVTSEEASTCLIENSVAKYENANVTYPLYRGGNFSFICQHEGHCQGGMKMTLTVPEAPGPAMPQEEAPSPNDGLPPPQAKPPARPLWTTTPVRRQKVQPRIEIMAAICGVIWCFAAVLSR